MNGDRVKGPRHRRKEVCAGPDPQLQQLLRLDGPAHSGEARQPTNDPADERAISWPGGIKPWSPDGRQFVFSSSRSGNRDIWVTPAEGGEPWQLTSGPSEDDWPVWSPDGQWVIFYSD